MASVRSGPQRARPDYQHPGQPPDDVRLTAPAIYGMQEARGSNPLSSTTGHRPHPASPASGSSASSSRSAAATVCVTRPSQAWRHCLSTARWRCLRPFRSELAPGHTAGGDACCRVPEPSAPVTRWDSDGAGAATRLPRASVSRSPVASGYRATRAVRSARAWCRRGHGRSRSCGRRTHPCPTSLCR
jgi:hypothetical protein